MGACEGIYLFLGGGGGHVYRCSLNSTVFLINCFFVAISSAHSKSERSVLALKTGPFRGVKYSPIFGSNVAHLNQGQYSPIS